eukprot:525943_1
MAIVTVAVLDRSVWLRVVVIMVAAMPVAVAIVTVAVFDRSVWLRVVVIMVASHARSRGYRDRSRIRPVRMASSGGHHGGHHGGRYARRSWCDRSRRPEHQPTKMQPRGVGEDS